MSINGLSNHLCVAVAIIISLAVASSTFHRAHASPDPHDFINSRQYKRNLSASKFREHPHWLSNYTWIPPQKFYGTRKRPSWEVDEVPETEAERKQREEREDWENKMREVSRREREKWKIHEDDEREEPSSSKPILMPLDNEEEKQTATRSNVKKSPESRQSNKFQESSIESSTVTKNNLYNGRWGMTMMQPAEERFIRKPPNPSRKSISLKSTDERTILAKSLTNGRWGMSIDAATENFPKRIPGEPLDLESSGSSSTHDVISAVNEPNRSMEDEKTTLSNSNSNNRRGMNVVETTGKEFSTKTFKSPRKRSKNEPTPIEEDFSRKSIFLDNLSVPAAMQNNRRGMNLKELPGRFLKEKSTPSKTAEAKVNNSVSFYNSRWGMSVDQRSEQVNIEDTRRSLTKHVELVSTASKPNALGRSIHSSQLNEETHVPETFSSDRWGMSVKEIPEEFLKEMSRRFLMPSENSDGAREDETTPRNIQMHTRRKDDGKTKNVLIGTAESKLPNDHLNRRWDMDVNSPSRDLSRTILRTRLTRIPEVRGRESLNQRVDSNARNNPSSQKSLLPTILTVPIFEIHLRPFLSIIRQLMIPRFFISSRMYRTSSNYNTPKTCYISCTKWNFVLK